jgi:predicted deoxyguanosinetriphosphate triphosphohydrolase
MRKRGNSLFEGNAQSFRIVTFLEPKVFTETQRKSDRWVGLNLTRTTLRALCKYPVIETPALRKQKHPKFGAYATPQDREYFDWLWDEPGGKVKATRTLATEILDVSDDIAYAVHDFEDGVWSRMIPLYALISGDELVVSPLANKVMERDVERAKRTKKRLFDRIEDVEATLDQVLSSLRIDADEIRKLDPSMRASHWAERPFDKFKLSRANLKNFCSGLIGYLIDDVTAGNDFRRPSDDCQRVLDVLTGMAWVWMIERSDLATRRYAQRQVIHELFEGYWKDPEMLPRREEWRLICEPGREEDKVWPEKARLICDHIGAMTDLYAHNVHREMYETGHALALEM